MLRLFNNFDELDLCICQLNDNDLWPYQKNFFFTKSTIFNTPVKIFIFFSLYKIFISVFKEDNSFTF